MTQPNAESTNVETSKEELQVATAEVSFSVNGFDDPTAVARAKAFYDYVLATMLHEEQLVVRRTTKLRYLTTIGFGLALVFLALAILQEERHFAIDFLCIGGFALSLLAVIFGINAIAVRPHAVVGLTTLKELLKSGVALQIPQEQMYRQLTEQMTATILANRKADAERPAFERWQSTAIGFAMYWLMILLVVTTLLHLFADIDRASADSSQPTAESSPTKEAGE